MRVTEQTRQETRSRILTEAHRLFDAQGFGATSTRDIARRSGLATGTLFNYFRTKDDLGATLVASALQQGRLAFFRGRRSDESLEESLFALVSAELRGLETHRAYADEVICTAFSPFASSDRGAAADEARASHMELVGRLLVEHALEPEGGLSPAWGHLYWSLFIGVLAAWSRDASPAHEDTLALLDESMRLFARALRTKENNDEA